MTVGRPRQFDYDEALDHAIRVFWEKGYEGTSLPDLTAAMGMNRPSIYAAFGNKEDLFCKALERYSQSAAERLEALLDAPTLHQSIEQFLLASADGYACKERPRGCMAVQGALVGSDESETARKAALKRREAVVGVLDKRFKRAIADGELAKGSDTMELARFYTTVLQGMSVQSVSGAACSELKAIAQRALKALPV